MTFKKLLSMVTLAGVLSVVSISGAVSPAHATGNAPMVLTFEVTNGTTITLPLTTSGSPSVDWGDNVSNNSFTHTYSGSTRTVTVSITEDPQFPIVGFGAWSWQGSEELRTVQSWGDLTLFSLYAAFNDCDGLTSVPNYLPATVTDLRYAFSESDSNPPEVTQWNTHNVTNMGGMFFSAPNFNQDISSWDTSNVTNMDYMFSRTFAFNRDLSSWDIRNLQSAQNIFSTSVISAHNLSKLVYLWWYKPHQQNVHFGATGRSIYQAASGAVEDFTLLDGWTFSFSSSILPSAQISVTSFPTASAVTVGQTIGSSTLTGGASVPGTFVFASPSTPVALGNQIALVLFIPDSFAYIPIEFQISVTGVAVQGSPSITPSPVTTPASTLAQTGTQTESLLQIVWIMLTLGCLLLGFKVRRIFH
ncbi:MAG: BspA family leucine-rich repeat surface protein [Aurantimicrobium sp.]